MFKKKKKAKHLPSGETLLTAAVQAGSADTVAVLLKRGVCVNISEQNKQGFNPLHLAAIDGNAEVLRILLDNYAEKESVDSLGMSALHLACQHGHSEVVRLLLNHGCCPNGSQHPKVASPVMCALGICDDVVLLLLRSGVDINKCEVWGNTAFFRAVASGNVAVVREMLSLAKPNISHTNDSGYNVFHSIFKVKHIPPPTNKISNERLENQREDQIDENSNTSSEQTEEVSEGLSKFCKTFELIMAYVDKNPGCMADVRKALTDAMPSCVRGGCVKCFKRALPYVDIHHRYSGKDGSSSDLLLHASSPNYLWSAIGPTWNFRGNIGGPTLEGDHLEMVLLLLERGVSLSVTQHAVMARLVWSLRPVGNDTNIYTIYIKAWGGWYPDHHVSTNLFRKLILNCRMDNEARLLCWAGFTPNEADLGILSRERRGIHNNQLKESVKYFTYNPRSLLNVAAVCVRQSLCDNVWHKAKLLNLPKILEDHITLKNIVHFG